MVIKDKDNMESKNTIYDLVIIGGSAAGSAAAVYGARRHLNQVIVAKDLGGEVALSGEVENWTGTIHTTGIELSKSFNEHVKSYNVPTEIGLEVTAIEQEKNYHIVKAKNYSGEEKIFETKAVLVASGIHPRELGVPGETELKGKGVTYCTVCDGPLFRGKTTATIGAGNSALESALMMSEIAEKVYVLTKYPKNNKDGFPKGETILTKKLLEKKNVEIIYSAMTTEITGEDLVSGVKYKIVGKEPTDVSPVADSGVVKEIQVNAAMVHIGAIPNSNFVDCVNKNKGAEIEINLKGETSCPGIFAAGDVTTLPHKQIIIAAGAGATAGLSAIEYINKWEES